MADRSRNSLVEALLDIADSYSGVGVGAATGRRMAAGAGAGGLAGRQMSEGRTLGALAGIDANAAQAQGFLDGYNTLAGLDEMAQYPGPATGGDWWMMQDGSMTAGGDRGGSVPGYDAAANVAYGGSPDGAVAYRNVGDAGVIDSRESMLLRTPLGRKRLRDGWESPEVDAANAAILRAALTRG